MINLQSSIFTGTDMLTVAFISLALAVAHISVTVLGTIALSALLERKGKL